MTVKGNQPTLFKPLKTHFEHAAPASVERQTEQTRDRQTQRTVSVLDTVVGLDPQWVRADLLKKGKETGDVMGHAP